MFAVCPVYLYNTLCECFSFLSVIPDMVGTGCEHDGVIYRNGQSFKPSCKYQCVCVNGAIGCIALCTESQPPRVWCQTPRRVKVRGQCCEQWICDEPKRGRKTAPRHIVESRRFILLLLLFFFSLQFPITRFNLREFCK